MSALELVVGIDAGGTHSRAVVMDRTGRQVATAAGEAGLVRAGDEGAVAERLADLTRRALAEVPGVDAGHPDAAKTGTETGTETGAETGASAGALFAGVAGAGHPDVRARLQAELAGRGVAGIVSVGTDLEVAFHDAFPAGPGVLVVVGTGSMALGRTTEGELIRTGGWGSLLGDEGSGYAIGLAALRAAARSEDGRGPDTALTGMILDNLELPTPRDLIPWVGLAAKSRVAALAPRVLELAEGGDEVARSIRSEAVEQIDHLLRAVAGRVGGAPLVALVGGLVLPGRPLRSSVEEVVSRMGLHIHTADLCPERGAARLALALLHHP